MKQIYSARDEMEAHFVRGLLEEQGISASVEGESLSAGALPVDRTTFPSVWIKEEDFPRAMPIIEEVRDRDKVDDEPAAQGEAWKCPQCGQTSESQFSACWSCGFSRTAS